MPAASKTARHPVTGGRQARRFHKSEPSIQFVRPPVCEQQHRAALGYIPVHPFLQLFHDQFAKAFALVCRQDSHVDELEEAAAIAYHAAHTDNSIRGRGLGYLDCKEGVGQADGRSVDGLWGETGGGAEMYVGLKTGSGMYYGVIFHDGQVFTYCKFGDLNASFN